MQKAEKYSHLLTQHARNGDTNRLFETAQEMMREGLVLNSVNFTQIANGCLQVKQYRKVFDVLSRMRKQSISPTSVTLRIAAKTCMDWNDKRSSVQALDAVVDWWATSDVPPDSEAWRLVLQAYSKLDRKRLNYVMFLRSSSIPKPDVLSFNVLLRSQGAKEVLETLGFMLSSRYGVMPDKVSYSIAAAALLREPHLLSKLARNRNDLYVDRIASGALTIFKAIRARMKMGKELATPFSNTVLLRLLTKKRPESDAILTELKTELRAMWREIRVQEKDLRLYNSLLSSCATLSECSLAAEIFAQMQEDGIRADLWTVNSLLACVTKLETKADVVMRTIEELGDEADKVTFGTGILACGLSKPTRPSDALYLLNMASRRKMANKHMVNAAIVSFNTDVGSALDSWKRMRRGESSLAQASRDRNAYEALLRICGRAARADMALKVVYVARKSGDLKFGMAANLLHAFEKGAREADVTDKLASIIQAPFYEHIKTTTLVIEERDDFPIERIRIRLGKNTEQSIPS